MSSRIFCQPRRTSAPPLSLDDLSLGPSLVDRVRLAGGTRKMFLSTSISLKFRIFSTFDYGLLKFFFVIDFCLCDELVFRTSMDKISQLKPTGSTVAYGSKLLRSALSLVVCLERRWAISKSKWSQWRDMLLVQLVWCESDRPGFFLMSYELYVILRHLGNESFSCGPMWPSKLLVPDMSRQMPTVFNASITEAGVKV